MVENNICPCCGRHCNLNEPHCNRGKEYIRTGIIVQSEYTNDHSKKVFDNEQYNLLDMDNRLIMNLRDSGHRIRFLFEGKGSQKRILIILHESGNMTQRELTERLGVQSGSASEVIKKLESAGLVLRTPSEEDRRTTNIQLTESGRIQAEEALERRKKRHQEMFSCLSADEKNVLLTLLEKLNEDWHIRYHENDRKNEHHKMHGKCHDSHGHYNHERHGNSHHH